MALLYLGPVMFGGTDTIIAYLRSHGMLSASKTCTRYLIINTNKIDYKNAHYGCSVAMEERHVAPGTIIHSDEWAAYNQVQRLSNVSSHGIVNHSINFVEPTTGVHTQNVESYWNRVKTKLKRMKGCCGDQLPSYLDEFMWRERHGTSALLALQNIMRDIAAKYSV